ncbi:hypothetical protein F5Y15DRAFT_424601 [Xylariaceae sp. FL0016]|nr:hypothetical protein F5Y15DRAFT_424601 [Xylariaceae sp. FL0016]
MSKLQVPIIAATLATVLACFVGIFQIPTFTDLGETISSVWSGFTNSLISPAAFTCDPHTYTIELISIDPLIIYIHDFVTDSEISHLLSLGASSFAPSLLTSNTGAKRQSQYRTSHSARLPADAPVVQCVLDRARGFMGSLLDVPLDDFQPPQLVRYAEGQQFKVHADWFDVPQARQPDAAAGTGGAAWNRPASFLAVLEDDCTAGETWFPSLPVPEGSRDKRRVWRAHEDGGLAFPPVKGNALFWVNLFANGTGDDRTRHAGLPPTSGMKTAMNIWPRKYYP